MNKPYIMTEEQFKKFEKYGNDPCFAWREGQKKLLEYIKTYVYNVWPDGDKKWQALLKGFGLGKSMKHRKPRVTHAG